MNRDFTDPDRADFVNFLVVLAVMALCGLLMLARPAHAGVMYLVQNGGFEQTSLSGSYQFGSGYPSEQVTDWTTSGYNFVYTPGTADTTGATGADGNVKLWGSGDGSSNGLPSTSPSGGNYVAADGAYEVSAITQTLNGMIVGAPVTVSFYWAGAQQSGFTGPTTDQWQVSLGTSTQSTSVVMLPTQGFSGWMKQTFTFIATSTSEVLSFLAVGTPSGQPPFALLDGVQATQVPEPASWAVLLTGLPGLVAAIRSRRRAALTRLAMQAGAPA